MKGKINGNKTYIWATIVMVATMWAQKSGWITAPEAGQLLALSGFGATFRSALKKMEQK